MGIYRGSGTTGTGLIAISRLTDLLDVEAEAAVNGDIIQYDGTTWFPQAWVGTLDDLTGITVTSPSIDEVLTYNGSIWVNGTSPAATTFVGLSDTPSSFSGETLKAVRVNAGETALEFYTPAGGGLTGVTDANGTALGSGAGVELAGVDRYTAIGVNALSSMTTADDNTAVGDSAGQALTQGGDNVLVGSGVLQTSTTSNSNVAVGYQAMGSSGNVSTTVAVGKQALINGGNSCVAIGYQAGWTGSGFSNIYIGDQAGFNETGNNKLYIAVDGTTTPLILGDFSSTGWLKVHVNNVEITRFDLDSTAGNTRFMIYDVDNGTLERVTVGAADSGGAGFKVLRIPN
jgi:hypothetical protein